MSKPLRFAIGLLFLVLIVVAARSQSLSKIEGQVFSEDGIPLAGVNISVVGTGYGAATDDRGYFQIENLFAGEYQVKASHIGYNSKIKTSVRVEKDIPVTLTFYLTEHVSIINEIIVEAEREINSSSLIRIDISSEDLSKSTASNLGEFLVQIPGITILDEGAGSGQKRISIRGSNPNQVLVLLDGIPLNDPLTGEVDLNLIPVSIIESIEIKKGGNSSETGSGSIGGSIDIKSKQAFGNEISLATNAGSFNAWQIQPSISGTIGNFNYFANYEYRTEKGDFPYTYQKPDGEEVSETRLNNEFDSEQYFLKFGYNSGAHWTSVQLNLFDSQRGLPGVVYFLTPYATSDVERRILSANYSYQTTNALLSMQLSGHTNRSEYQNIWPPDPPLKYRTVPPYHTKYDVSSYQGILNGNYQWHPENRAAVQFSYRRDIFKDENLMIPLLDPVSETDNRQLGMAAENTWDFPRPDWLQHANLKFAIRYDLIRFDNPEGYREDDYLSPKIGLLVAHQEKWRIILQTNAGRSFRSPTFGDLYYQDFRVRGNADLLPEKSLDFDAGLTIGLPWLQKPEFGITYFRQEIENLIIWELGSFATWQPTNLNAFIDGLEYSLQWNLWPEHLSLHIDHTYLNARDRSGRHTTDDKYLIYRPKHTTKLMLDLKFQRFNIQYFKRIVSERYVTPSNTVSLPGYMVDDLSFVFDFSLGDFDFLTKAMLLNIFDTKYEIIEHAPLPGRHWRAGLEIKF